MSHVFLSYAREDIAKAKQLTRVLEEQGLEVWWDRQIPPGKTFDQVIEEALDNASWSIVLWSRHSIDSDWVKAEAEEASRRGILVPALVEDVRPPLAFRRIEAAELQDWDGGPDHPEIRQLLRVLQGESAPPEVEPVPAVVVPEPAAPPIQPQPAVSNVPPGQQGKAPGSGWLKPVLFLGVGGAALVGVLGLLVVVAAMMGTEDPESFNAVPADSRATGIEVTDTGPGPTDAESGTITLQYTGDFYQCTLNLVVDIAGRSVTPNSNPFLVHDVPLGSNPYTVGGTINCPTMGSCQASGTGTLNVVDGAAYNVVWQNTAFGQCRVSFMTMS